MNLFLVQSEKTQEINGITQTESNPIMKSQYSKSDILREDGASKQLCSQLCPVVSVVKTSVQCPASSASPQLSVGSVCHVSTFL